MKKLSIIAASLLMCSSVIRAMDTAGIAEALPSEAAFTTATDKNPIVATYGCAPCIGVGGYDPTNKSAFVVHFANAKEVKEYGNLICENIRSVSPKTHAQPIQIHLRGGYRHMSEDTVEAIKVWMQSQPDLPMQIVSEDLFTRSDGGSLLVDARTGRVGEYAPLTNPHHRDITETDVLRITCGIPNIRIAYTPGCNPTKTMCEALMAISQGFSQKFQPHAFGCAGPPCMNSMRSPFPEFVDLDLLGGPTNYQKSERTDPRIQTPLQIAARKGDVGRVQQLLAEGADVNAKHVAFGTALAQAAMEGRLGVVNVLLSFAGIDVDGCVKISGDTPLLKALSWKRSDVAVALINAGANIHIDDGIGFTPLHKAAWKGLMEPARLLLQKGAVRSSMIRVGGYGGKTPAEMAKSEAMRQLICNFRALICIKE